MDNNRLPATRSGSRRTPVLSPYTGVIRLTPTGRLKDDTGAYV